MDVAMKLFAVALVSCVSMSSAWKWAVAICLGMAVLVWVTHPYMQPQVRKMGLHFKNIIYMHIAYIIFWECPHA